MDLYVIGNQFIDDDCNNYISFNDIENYDSGIDSPRMGLDYIPDLVDDDDWSDQQYYEYLYTRASINEGIALDCMVRGRGISRYLSVLNSDDFVKFEQEDIEIIEIEYHLSINDVDNLQIDLRNILSNFISRENSHLDEARRCWLLIKEITDENSSIILRDEMYRSRQHFLLDNYRVIG